jgi:hypothetical protein
VEAVVEAAVVRVVVVVVVTVVVVVSLRAGTGAFARSGRRT